MINEQKNIEEKLKNLTKNTDNIEELEKNYNSLIEILDLLSKNIREYRIQYAQKLSKLIEEKLKTLELKEAKFDISVLPAQRNENGTDSVEFMISTNKNKDLGPLSKVASGGEISRVILALKSIFALCDKVSTVVFDEIDTGISGITSNAVANSIIELSKSTQIICITHQPIICAKADNFIWINKTHGTKTDVTIEVLDESQRLSALAQLASGEITQQTIDFAKTLVK